VYPCPTMGHIALYPACMRGLWWCGACPVSVLARLLGFMVTSHNVASVQYSGHGSWAHGDRPPRGGEGGPAGAMRFYRVLLKL